MSDLISRIDAISVLEIFTQTDTLGHTPKQIVEALPSAQQWIPCSERLPRLDEEVLATTAWNDITMAWRIGIDTWFIHEGNTNATTDDLIAWCPLPEPYKGEDNV